MKSDRLIGNDWNNPRKDSDDYNQDRGNVSKERWWNFRYILIEFANI